MVVRWTPEVDQILLAKIIETHKLVVDVKAVAAAWPGDHEAQPTARAISERIHKIRQLAGKSAGGSGGSKISPTPNKTSGASMVTGVTGAAKPRNSGTKSTPIKTQEGEDSGEDTPISKKRMKKEIDANDGDSDAESPAKRRTANPKSRKPGSARQTPGASASKRKPSSVSTDSPTKPDGHTFSTASNGTGIKKLDTTSNLNGAVIHTAPRFSPRTASFQSQDPFLSSPSGSCDQNSLNGIDHTDPNPGAIVDSNGNIIGGKESRLPFNIGADPVPTIAETVVGLRRPRGTDQFRTQMTLSDRSGADMWGKASEDNMEDVDGGYLL